VHEARLPVEPVHGVPVVLAPEEIDITNATMLRAALLAAAANGHQAFVVDMTRTRFCDSSGVHALVAAHRRAQAEHRQMLLAGPGAAVSRVFSITGLDRVIPIFASLDEALAHTAAAMDASQPPKHLMLLDGGRLHGAAAPPGDVSMPAAATSHDLGGASEGRLRLGVPGQASADNTAAAAQWCSLAASQAGGADTGRPAAAVHNGRGQAGARHDAAGGYFAAGMARPARSYPAAG
jgi:anti-sigma B factor antagonist